MQLLSFSVAFLLVGLTCQSVIMNNKSANGIQQEVFPSVRKCMNKSEILECLKDEAIKTLDSAISSDKEFMVNKFLTIRKNQNFNITETNAARGAQVDSNAALTRKMVDFVKSRTFSFGFGPSSNDDEDEDEEEEIEDENAVAEGEEGSYKMGKLFVFKVTI